MFQVQCTCKDEPVKLLKDLLGRPSAVRLLVSLAAQEQGGSERSSKADYCKSEYHTHDYLCNPSELRN